MRFILFVCFTLSLSILYGQNLISNGSFEEYNICPIGRSQLINCNGWFDIVATTDYLLCEGETATLNVLPSSTGAHTGDGCVGIASHGISINTETFGQELLSTLPVGATFNLTFYSKVTSNNNYNDECGGVFLYGFSTLPSGLPSSYACPSSLSGIELLGSSENIIGEDWVLYEIDFIVTTQINYIALALECFGCQKFVFLDDLELYETSVQSDLEEEDPESEFDCFEFPNVITPNNDGVNDLFTVTTDCIAEGSIRILNRWGNTVYYSNNLSNSWNGTNNGQNVSSGTYFYIIESQLIQEKVKSGFLTVVN
jgi:gliding motility-associated-like protein